MKSRSSICANKDLRPRLVARALELEALKYGEFTLSSGKKSNYYFDGRKLSLDPEGAYLIGRCLLPLVLKAGVQAVGGPTIGADPIVAALAVTSYIEGTPVAAFVVRSKVKEYGTRKLIEGNIVKGSRVAMVDDTCSTGGNLLKAIEAVEAEGCNVVQVLVVMDRNQGGSEILKLRGFKFTSLMEVDNEGSLRVWGDE